MKVQTDTKIDIVNLTHQAYTSLLKNIYEEFLALKAQSTSDDVGENAPPEAQEIKAAGN